MPRGLYSDFSKRSLPQCTPRGRRRSTIRKSGGRCLWCARGAPSWWWGGSERTIRSSCLYLNGKEAKSIGSARSPNGARAICCAHKLLAARAAVASRRDHHSQGDEAGGGGARGCIRVATPYVLLVVFGYLWRDTWCSTFFHVIFNLLKQDHFYHYQETKNDISDQ